MIFNSKQLEELENIHDSTGAFEEEADDDGGFDEVGEAAMDWRRGLIEEAAENIKRAKTRPVDPSITYPVNSMLFDREVRRFGRVQRSVPGFLKIVYLSGGDREFGTLDVVGYLRDQGAQKRLSELSEQLGMPDVDVATELERLGITPLEEPEVPDEAAPAAAAAAAAEAAPVPPPLPKAAKGARARVEPEEVEEEEEEVETAAAEEEDDLPRLGDDVDDEEGAPKKGAKAGKVAAKPEKKVDKKVEAERTEKKGKPAPAAAPPQRTSSKAIPVVEKSAARMIAPEKSGRLSAPAAEKSGRVPAPAPEKSGRLTAPAKPAKAAAAPEKTDAKAAAKPAATKPAKAAAPATKKAAAPAGKGVNPIDDPNGFIKQNFQQMSNRELARLTGLSEHTIRRKLGEWGMKRKKEL